MEENLKNGTSIREYWQSRQDTTTNHLILCLQEKVLRCKSGAPTQNGSKSSNMRTDHSSTSTRIWYITFGKSRMRKDKKLKSEIDQAKLTCSEQLNILIRKHQPLQRDSMQNSTFIAIDHSTWYQDYQWKELLNALELTMSTSRDGETIFYDKNVKFFNSPKPQRIINGSLIHLIGSYDLDL
jgi:hypothetical protein